VTWHVGRSATTVVKSSAVTRGSRTRFVDGGSGQVSIRALGASDYACTSRLAIRCFKKLHEATGALVRREEGDYDLPRAAALASEFFAYLDQGEVIAEMGT